MSDQPKPSLGELRAEIDGIDAAIHRLLIERGTIVDRLIAAKRGAETGSAFRPGREIDMMRRLVARHQGAIPVHAVVHIWHTIIATFTHLQAPFEVHVHAQPGQEARAFAEFHFGFAVPMSMHATAQDVVTRVGSAANALGLIFLDDAVEPWWEALMRADAPAIIAGLPLVVTEGEACRAVLVGDARTDSTGLDWRLLAVEGTGKIAGLHPLAACRKAGRDHLLIAAPREGEALAVASSLLGAGFTVEAARQVGYIAQPVAA